MEGCRSWPSPIRRSSDTCPPADTRPADPTQSLRPSIVQLKSKTLKSKCQRSAKLTLFGRRPHVGSDVQLGCTPFGCRSGMPDSEGPPNSGGPSHVSRRRLASSNYIRSFMPESAGERKTPQTSPPGLRFPTNRFRLSGRYRIDASTHRRRLFRALWTRRIESDTRVFLTRFWQ